jgi:trans-2,3-dihydro-3-hydroxyanthranilate isomerase
MTDKNESRPKFYICDVFGEGKYSGNQLAVFFNCDTLSGEEMQSIAREINFSETTFVASVPEEDGSFVVRIFTPRSEVDFAGHPTLGTAYIIRKQLRLQEENIVLNLNVGLVPVTFSTNDDLVWMEQVQPQFGQVLDVSRIASTLGLHDEDIDTRFPIEEVSTGLPTIIVPLKTGEALHRVSVVREIYDPLVAETWAKLLFAFAP